MNPYGSAVVIALVLVAAVLMPIFAIDRSASPVSLAAATSFPTYAYSGSTLPCSTTTTSATSTTVGGAGASLAEVAWARLVGVALIMVGYVIDRKRRWHERRRSYRFMRLQ